MGEKQFIQLLQFIAIWVLLWVFVVFVMEESFTQFILNYRFYLLIVSVSYFYYYSIQYDLDKKSELIRNVIIYGNLYLFAHIFFRPLLNISHELFVLLGLIILGIWWTTKLKTRRRYLLQVLGGIFIFFIMISGLFYLYPDKPDVDGFINNRKNKISVLGIEESVPKKEAYIQIVDSKKTSDFEIIPQFEKSLTENCKISYPSLKKQRDEDIVIVTSYGDVFWILPQSEIQLEFDGNKLIELRKLNGEIRHLSGIFDSSVKFSGNSENFQWPESIQGIQYQYKYEFISHLKNQISENDMSFANNTIMYDIDGKIIKFLARMFPATFNKNLNNYKEFQNYFAWMSDDNDGLSKYSAGKKSGSYSLWKSLIENMKIGKSNTYNIFKNH